MGAVIANRPIRQLAREDPRIPVVSIGDVTTVPSKRNFVHRFGEILICSLGVGVSHIVQDGNCKRRPVAGLTGGLEAQDIRFGCTIRRRNLVVVSGIRLQSSNLHIMEESFNFFLKKKVRCLSHMFLSTSGQVTHWLHWVTATSEHGGVRSYLRTLSTSNRVEAVQSTGHPTYVLVTPVALRYKACSELPQNTIGASPRPNVVW